MPTFKKSHVASARPQVPICVCNLCACAGKSQTRVDIAWQRVDQWQNVKLYAFQPYWLLTNFF